MWLLCPHLLRNRTFYIDSACWWWHCVEVRFRRFGERSSRWNEANAKECNRHKHSSRPRKGVKSTRATLLFITLLPQNNKANYAILITLFFLPPANKMDITINRRLGKQLRKIICKG